MLSALIIDDEAPSREELKALLATADDIDIVGECANDCVRMLCFSTFRCRVSAGSRWWE